MFQVTDFMTPEPITIDPTETISDAIDLMRLNHIHRIPVVGKDNELVGLITEGMIGANQSATSLSIYELNYLLSKTKVKSIMEKHPYSINQDALMEEAAALLLSQDIGCLPVVNNAGQVVGILTQNDVFKSYLELLGWDSDGSRLILNLPDKVGVLEQLTDRFAENNVNIRNITVYDVDDDKKESKVLIKTNGLIPQEFIELLKEQGYDIAEVIDFSVAR